MLTERQGRMCSLTSHVLLHQLIRNITAVLPFEPDIEIERPDLSVFSLDLQYYTLGCSSKHERYVGCVTMSVFSIVRDCSCQCIVRNRHFIA